VAVECEVTLQYVYPTNAPRGTLVLNGRTEAPVVGGAITQTVQVFVDVDPPGTKTFSTYSCKLLAFLDEGLGWRDFETDVGAKGGTVPSANGRLTYLALAGGSPPAGTQPFVRGGGIIWAPAP
jgi:hypothetical protein